MTFINGEKIIQLSDFVFNIKTEYDDYYNLKNTLDLNKLFNETLQEFKLNEKVKTSEINISIDNKLSIEQSLIITDPVRLKQILNNLLVNAFKFTNKGKIVFGCELLGKNLLFYVKDSGIGIPKDKLELVFKRFRQVNEKVFIREQGGAGLGLSICKGILELMDGKIWVESETKIGSTFYFTIPFKPFFNNDLNNNLDNSAENPVWHNKKVLIVEDYPSNIEYILELLSHTKIKCFVASNGKNALNLLNEEKLFDIVLMDIGLPDMDGYELAQKLKAIEPKLIIVAQTAFASGSNKDKCLEAGCTDYISKPMSQEKLIEIMKKYI